MAYTKIVFQNSPSTATPLNAENLNHMDDQIALNDQRLTEIETSYVKSFNGRKGEVTPQANDYNMSQITPTNGATVGQIPIVRNDGTAEEPNLTFHMEDVPSSGHTIVDQDGNKLTQEPKMKFLDAFVGDNSTDEVTEIENIKEVSPADYASTTDEGIIVCDDGEDAVIHPSSEDYVEVMADGDKTYATLLNELFTETDLTKKTPYSALVIGSKYYHIRYSAELLNICFSSYGIDTSLYGEDVILQNNSSSYNHIAGGTVTDYSSNKPSNGTKITLYYGNKKATVDLQTTANRCLMSDGNNLEQVYSEKVTSGSGTNISIEIYKYGKVVYVVFGNGRYTASANATLATIPKGFRPMIVYADFRDTYSDKRIRIKPDGTVYCDEALSDVIIRGSLCYIAN